VRHAVEYLDAHFPASGVPGCQQALGTHALAQIPNKSRKKVSEDLSLKAGDPQSPDKRKALRALLLCQRVYFSDWWGGRTKNEVWAKFDAILANPGWKRMSLAHWKGRSEKEIREGIAMFWPVQAATRVLFAAAGRRGPPNGVGSIGANVTLSRSDTLCVGEVSTCYNGVTAWLLMSGVVSLRWYMKDTSPAGKNSCDQLFGVGVETWDSSTQYLPTDNPPDVDEGKIIHMYAEQNNNWNGHWVVCNGDDPATICGVNNAHMDDDLYGDDDVHHQGVGVVLKDYTRKATLHRQFLAYNGELTYLDRRDQTLSENEMPRLKYDPPRYMTAHFIVIDPETMPTRM
jgi:hypothetical protein